MISVPRKLHDRLECLRELYACSASHPSAQSCISQCVYICESMFVFHAPGMVSIKQEERLNSMHENLDVMNAHIAKLHEKLRAIDVERFVDQPLVTTFLIPIKDHEDKTMRYDEIKLPVANNGDIDSEDLKAFYEKLSKHPVIIPNIRNKSTPTYDTSALRVHTLFATIVKICDENISTLHTMPSCPQPRPAA